MIFSNAEKTELGNDFYPNGARHRAQHAYLLPTHCHPGGHRLRFSYPCRGTIWLKGQQIFSISAW